MKAIVITSCILSLGVIASQADPLTENQKLDFVDYYKKRVKLLETFPDHPQVQVVFVDMDADGEEEALATNHGSSYEDGNSWAAFRKTGDTWETIRGFDNKAKVIRPGSGVFARPGEIFQIIRHDGTIEFLVLHENFDKLAPDGLGDLYKIRFSVDDKGVLQQEQVKNLERYIAYAGVNRSGLVSKLEALKVEYFAGDGLAKNQEQNKAQHPTDGAAEPEKPKE